MPNDRDKKDGFLYNLDKKAYEFIKKNDPTGIVKHYYEETSLGKIEKDATKMIDKKIDNIISDVGNTFEKINESLKGVITGQNKNNNKSIPAIDNSNPIKR